MDPVSREVWIRGVRLYVCMYVSILQHDRKSSSEVNQGKTWQKHESILYIGSTDTFVHVCVKIIHFGGIFMLFFFKDKIWLFLTVIYADKDATETVLHLNYSLNLIPHDSIYPSVRIVRESQ